MPSSKIHNALWRRYRSPMLLGSVSVGAVVSAATGGDLYLGTLTATSVYCGYTVGRVITPDLDLISITESEALAIKSVIFLPLVAWTTLYARIMQVLGGHRGFWSHSLILSTFIRLCWFAFPVVVVLHLVDLLPLAAQHPVVFIGLLVGLSIADALHIGADLIETNRKRFIRKTSARRVRGSAD